MQTAVVYATLTRPEMVFGINKDAIPLFALLFGIFMIIKVSIQALNFFELTEFSLSMLWVVPFGSLVYLIFYITGKIDPFYFSIDRRCSKLRTKKFSQNRGNLYVS